MLEWIGRLPPPKQQPNLVFAAARWHGVPAPGPYDGFRAAVLSERPAIRDTILRRSTQTNEPLRQATIMPVLPEITRTAAPDGLPSERFVLGLDGRAVAWTHGHGASLTWLA